MVKHYRTFNGLCYTRHSNHNTERAAKAMCVVLRDWGHKARWVKRGDDHRYDVFKRDKREEEE